MKRNGFIIRESRVTEILLWCLAPALCAFGGMILFGTFMQGKIGAGIFYALPFLLMAGLFIRGALMFHKEAEASGRLSIDGEHLLLQRKALKKEYSVTDIVWYRVGFVNKSRPQIEIQFKDEETFLCVSYTERNKTKKFMEQNSIKRR